MRRLACAMLVLAMAACGGSDDDDGPTGPGGGVGAGTVSATVDGAAFSANLAVQAVRTAQQITISGVSNNQRQIVINLLNVNSTGTVNVGGGTLHVLQYSQGSQTWVSSLVGGTGTVNLTTLTATRAVGTFSFTGMPGPGSGATGNKAITNGAFDVTF